MANTTEPGAVHADDLGYFFDNNFNPQAEHTPINPGSIEEKAINRYIRLWGNFLKFGNPTPNPNEFYLTWKPVTKDCLHYLDVDEELSMKTNPEEERMRIWRDIYKSHEKTKRFMK